MKAKSSNKNQDKYIFKSKEKKLTVLPFQVAVLSQSKKIGGFYLSTYVIVRLITTLFSIKASLNDA